MWLATEVATIWYTYQKELHGQSYTLQLSDINPLNAELNLIYHLLALLGAHHILHVSRIGVKQRGFRKDGYVESMQEIYTKYRQENATYNYYLDTCCVAK